MEKKDIIGFYDEFAGEKYLTEIRRFGIRYDEMVEQLVKFIRIEKPQNVLDIGCGIGNIDEAILAQSPDTRITGIDISPDMINVAKNRLKSFGGQVTLLNQDALSYEPQDSFDLIFSNIAIHNLNTDEKIKILSKIQQWLKKDGIFIWGDFMNWTDKTVESFCMEERKQIILTSGVDPDFVEEVLQKENQDPRISVSEALELLKNSGFKDIDVLWVWSFLAIFRGRKE